jgi:hypothetical protein
MRSIYAFPGVVLTLAGLHFTQLLNPKILQAILNNSEGRKEEQRD